MSMTQVCPWATPSAGAIDELHALRLPSREHILLHRALLVLFLVQSAA